MSETEEDRAYYQAAEAAFIRRRGTPFLLSPKDFALLKEWRALGVPIDAIEQGIDATFSRREDRSPARSGRVNSLSYCRGAVLEAWERRLQTSVGRGSRVRAAEPDVARVLEALARRLRQVASLRPDLSPPLESALRSIERLGKSPRSAEETEASLARLDKRLAGALRDALSEGERRRLDAEVEASLARARIRMDAEAAERTARALARRTLRELLDLPRLTLL
jgi:hypothetical protein